MSLLRKLFNHCPSLNELPLDKNIIYQSEKRESDARSNGRAQRRTTFYLKKGILRVIASSMFVAQPSAAWGLASLLSLLVLATRHA